MATKRFTQFGTNGTSPIVPTNPIVNFDESGGYVSDIDYLTVKGYQGLTFQIDSAPYPITIYNTNGLWSWHVNREVGLKSLTFDPNTFVSGKDIIVTIT